MSLGDTSLHDTVFSELPEGVLNESTGGAPGARISQSRSTSPMPPGSNRKQAASVAIQGAASAVDNRMNDINWTENFNTMMKRTEE